MPVEDYVFCSQGCGRRTDMPDGVCRECRQSVLVWICNELQIEDVEN